MAKITVKPDCGNAPRKLFLKDFHIAFAEGDTALITNNVADDITWEFVGDKVVRGKADFVEVLEQWIKKKVVELVIHNIITHGKEAAVNGDITLANGKKYSFCDIYAFQGAKGNTIKSITSYEIDLNGDAK
jgi:hypothetical protein